VYYLIILLVYAAVDAIACLGLSQQFGIAGVTNFGFIIFQAAGAYVAAVLALPPDTANGGFQTYIGGFSLPFPLPWIGAAAAGALLALPFGAEFLVAETRLELQSDEDGFHFGSVVDLGLGFDANLVRAGVVCGFGFVGEKPGVTVLSEAKQVSFGSEGAAREVEEGVHFVGARGDFAES
jgi:hypothetical protein